MGNYVEAISPNAPTFGSRPVFKKATQVALPSGESQ